MAGVFWANREMKTKMGGGNVMDSVCTIKQYSGARGSLQKDLFD